MENLKYIESSGQQSTEFNTAKRKVKKLKSFYSHLIVYVFCNIFFVIINYSNLEVGEGYFHWENFTILFFWGIGIAFHAIATFVPNFIFASDWEETKIQELMNKVPKTTWE